MSDYVVYKDQDYLETKKPATHAIVISVGEYAYLSGGSGSRLAKLDGGLQQLSSPPESAKTFAKWLLDEFNNPEKPLATLSMLISEKGGPSTFKHNKLPAPVTLKEATIDHVEEAVWNWKDFGDKHEDNLVLFFFCGHGVARGLDGVTLLLADYGENDNKPMKGAVNFAAMHRGMAQCKASEQCFFIDACRKVSDIATRTTEKGNSIIQDDQNRPHNSPWNFAVFYSTLGGESAYGRKNKPSYFTEVLIHGLNGTGSNNRNANSKWRVSTGDLNTAIHRSLLLRGKKKQVPMTGQVYFEFHEPKQDPVALAVVNCDPKSKNERATFYCRQNNKKIDSRQPDAKDWDLIVPYGHYDFIAEISASKGRKLNESIFPPYKEVNIEVPS